MERKSDFFMAIFQQFFDPLSQPKVTAGRDNLFSHMLSVRTSPFFKSSKTKQQKTMVATFETVGLAEWIIDDTCLVTIAFINCDREMLNNVNFLWSSLECLFLWNITIRLISLSKPWIIPHISNAKTVFLCCLVNVSCAFSLTWVHVWFHACLLTLF